MSNSNQEKHVIFGTGPLGLAVMEELIMKGTPVRMVNTSGKAHVPEGVEVVKGDAYSMESALEVTSAAQVVYQCAQPTYKGWSQKFPTLQANILEGAATHGARLVVPEDMGLYGEVDGKIHEDLPYKAQTSKGRVRAVMADAALALHRDGKARVVIGRGSDFFGPCVLDSMLGARAIYRALEGKAAQLAGSLDVPHTFTFIEDFGRALVLLGEREEALGQAWHVPNDRPTITQQENMEIFFEEIGRPVKINAMNRDRLMADSLIHPEARELLEMMYRFEKPFVVDCSKFERTFNVSATPMREAVWRTVAWYRANPR